MYAVIFEVEPAPGRRQDYLDIAAQLRPELEQIDGFISVERFQSLTQEGKILSLSFWRDEEAVVRWRRHEQHRDAQRAGCGGIFKNYRLRVAAIVRDYGLDDRAGEPADRLQLGIQRQGARSGDCELAPAQCEIVELGGAAGIPPCCRCLARRAGRYRPFDGEAKGELIDQVAKRVGRLRNRRL